MIARSWGFESLPGHQVVVPYQKNRIFGIPVRQAGFLVFKGPSRRTGTSAARSLTLLLALTGLCGSRALCERLPQRKLAKMNHQGKLHPAKDSHEILALVRSAIVSVFPYRGVLIVTFPSLDSLKNRSRSFRLTDNRHRMPVDANPIFGNPDEPGAIDELADRLVKTLIYSERLAYDGDIAISLPELVDADPVALRVGSRTIYLEFGFVECDEYRGA